jgi:hypothetical protein
MAAKAPDVIAGGTGRTWSEIASHPHTEGPYCFILSRVKKFDIPIPTKGKQGFWEWDMNDF